MKENQVAGLLLNPTTGRPVGDPPALADVPRKGAIFNFLDTGVDVERELHGAPGHVKSSLDRAASEDPVFNVRASMQAWEEVLYVPLTDGTTVTAAAEATIFPIFTLPANYLYPGRAMKWTVMGRLSSAITTPGTFTWKLAYSATGVGAVVVAQTGAFAPDPTAAATNLPWMLEAWTVCRSNGTAGAVMGWIRMGFGGDYDDASATTLKGNLDMELGGSAGVAAPATAAVDTTVARALNPTYTPSLTTASMTGHVGILEALT